MANISVEPISLNEGRRRLPFVSEVDREEEGWAIVRWFPREHIVDTSRLTIELEGTFSSNMWTIKNPHRIVM